MKSAPPPTPALLAKLWSIIVPARGLALTFPQPSAATIIKSCRLSLRAVSQSYPFCTPTITTTIGHCHLSQSALPSGHCFPWPSCSPGFLSYVWPGPSRHLQCRRRPHRHPAAHARDGARGAGTKPGTPPEPETHLQKAVGTRQAGEAWGGALRVLVPRPGCSGPCRRPGAWHNIGGAASQWRARRLTSVFVTFQGSFHCPNRS